MSEEASKIRPNTFQTPNALVDDGAMAALTGNEVKCYLFIVRKTFGWNKQSDRIAKSQIMEATGLGETAVDGCMAYLVKFGLVLRLAENDPSKNHGVLWSLQTDDSRINHSQLTARIETASRKKAVVMQEIRAKKDSSGGGVDGQPQVDGQGGGGVDGQPPQKTLSKDINNNNDSGEVFKIYEAEFGGLTPMIREQILDAEKTYPPDWLPEAMQIAVARNVRNWAFVEGILKKCKAKNVRPSLSKLENQNGRTAGNQNNRKPNSTSPKADKRRPDPAVAERVRQRAREERAAAGL